MATATKVDLLSKPINKIRWSDIEENDDDGEELRFLLPPTVVIGPDKKGIKKVIEYKFNDEKKLVKVTTTSRVRKIKTIVNKRVLERRTWAKFGDAVHEDVGARLTVTSSEDVLLERPKPPGSRVEDIKAAENSLVQKSGGTLMVCRNCGKKGDHWTARCPYKDLAQQTEALNLTDANAAASSGTGSSGKNSYIPPSKRRGAEGTSIELDTKRSHNDENAVKVMNISEDTLEADLRELFGVFGPISRVYIPCDRLTGLNRGFGFVNFVDREDAEIAIQKLNGYGYDNLILNVEWAPKKYIHTASLSRRN